MRSVGGDSYILRGIIGNFKATAVLNTIQQLMQIEVYIPPLRFFRHSLRNLKTPLGIDPQSKNHMCWKIKHVVDI
jgi:hypothetical protein